MAAEPVPQEAQRLLKLLNEKNPALQIPDDYIDTHIHFEGGDLPVQPGALKSGALSAAAFAAFGAVASQIAHDRYGSDPCHVTINTDHAGYFLAMPALIKAEKSPVDWQRGAWEKEMDRAATLIYPTKDGRWFQLHGDLDCHALFRDIGLECNMDASREEAYGVVKRWTLQYTADELEAMMVKFGHSGSKCYEPEEWLATDMGKALKDKPLINIEQVNKTNGPVPYPPAQNKRILEGIKVVEMVRIIAGPTIGRTLAELGAQVIKVNPPHLRDINLLQYTLTTGTHTVSLDARQPEEKAQLENLIAEADVFIDGFRPGSLERLGFGKERVMQLAGSKGIIYIDENAYGVEGPYRHRPGWQQIADTASGCAVMQGKSLGAEGAVLPPLPISDLVTGVLGAVTVLCGIRDRARHGGNYFGVACLTSYDMFCVSKQVGLYPQELVQKVERTFDFGPMTPRDDVARLLGIVVQAWYKKRPEHTNFDGPLFVSFEDGPFGPSKQLAPVAQIDNYPSSWDHPPRPYGYDKPTFDY